MLRRWMTFPLSRFGLGAFGRPPSSGGGGGGGPGATDMTWNGAAMTWGGQTMTWS